MKSFIILSFIALLANVAMAQQSFTVAYEQETKMKMSAKEKADPKAQAFLQKMPKSFTSNFELSCDGKISLYKKVEKKKEAASEGNVFFYGDKSEDIYYHDFTSDKNLHQQDFFGKTFLVEGELEPRKWKITKEQRKIKDYLCFKAVSGDSTEQVMVWFTPQIPTQAAPKFLEGLPGLILMASMNQGKTILTATDIQVGKVDKENLTAPEKGKKITKKKYDKIVAKKKKEMEERYGGRNKGSRIIIMD